MKGSPGERGDLFSLHDLDSIYEKISFTNFRSTRQGRKIDPAKALVLCFGDVLRDSLKENPEQFESLPEDFEPSARVLHRLV